MTIFGIQLFLFTCKHTLYALITYWEKYVFYHLYYEVKLKLYILNDSKTNKYTNHGRRPIEFT